MCLDNKWLAFLSSHRSIHIKYYKILHDAFTFIDVCWPDSVTFNVFFCLFVCVAVNTLNALQPARSKHVSPFWYILWWRAAQGQVLWLTPVLTGSSTPQSQLANAAVPSHSNISSLFLSSVMDASGTKMYVLSLSCCSGHSFENTTCLYLFALI